MERAENAVYRALIAARAVTASDLHLAAGELAAIRLDGGIVRPGDDPCYAALATANEIFTRRIEPEAIRDFLTIVAAGNRAAADLGRDGIFDAAFDGGDTVGAVRVHAFVDVRGIRLALRLLATQVPSFSHLGLPPVLLDVFLAKTGLVLFCGPTGSGKSTAQAACLQHVAESKSGDGIHIMTLEDPIEYRLRSGRSIVSQVEVGSGTQVATFRTGLTSILRSDPDVLMIGEARDEFALQAVIELAEQGRMATTSVHARDASSVFDRIIGTFPTAAQPQIRTQLANAISAVVVLRLVPRIGGGRVAASEVLIATDAVRAFVRDGQTEQIRNAIVTGRALKMHTLEADLSRLVDERSITAATAQRAAVRPEQLRFGVPHGDARRADVRAAV